MIIERVFKKVLSVLRLLDTNFESLENLMMLCYTSLERYWPH